jgi:hypothetical protein
VRVGCRLCQHGIQAIIEPHRLHHFLQDRSMHRSRGAQS